MKKILFLITKGNFGGAQRYVFDLAVGLPKDTFDVVVAYGEGKELGERLQANGIKTIVIKNLARDINILKEFAVLFELIKLYKKEKPDIVHINSSKIGGLGALAGRLARVPQIIFTGHGWAFNEDRNIISKMVIFFLHALTIIFAHKTIAVSEETKRQITSKFGSLKNKITVIHNGIKMSEPLIKTEARQLILKTISLADCVSGLGKNENANPNTFWIGTVGELHPIKGHSYLLEALAELHEDNKLKGVQLFIIGEGQERLKLLKQISGFGLSKNVFLTGNIRNASNLMSAFDLFIFPSLSEAFPYAILEAGSAGLPVISSKVGGIYEIIENKQNGILVRPKDVLDLKIQILTLIQNQELRNAYSKNLQQTIRTEFSKQQMLEKTISLYKQ